MRTAVKISIVILLFIVGAFSCRKELHKPEYITENVIVIVIDGARYSETWGDSSRQNIPRLSGISKSGVIYTQFYNNGPTYTAAGHTAITTGFYQEIENSGKELPLFPSFFQLLNVKDTNNKELTWIVASKDKLEVLKNCQYAGYKDQYEPFTDCGINGLGSGYREDSLTLNALTQVLSAHHPKLTLVNFREPDYSAHSGSWEKYIAGIRNSDEYAYRIWSYIQENPYYRGKTTLFITNDHGRHLDSISGGFASHGDGCAGCRHINLYAFGPDFKKGVITDRKRELIDINATISELLHLDREFGKGEKMFELFK